MVIARWPSLHRSHNSPTVESTSEEQASVSLQPPVPVRRNLLGIQLPNAAFFSKFRRKSPPRVQENARRASIVQPLGMPRASIEVDPTSIMPELEVVFDSDETTADGAQISERPVHAEPLEEDTAYRYWRIQGRSGRRNAEIALVRKDWSSMSSPFTTQPKVMDDGLYIERPSVKRNYYDVPSPSTIPNMVEPYPLLRKPRAGHTDEHNDLHLSAPTYMAQSQDLPSKQQKRHSLSRGKMDKLISENRYDDNVLARVDTITSTPTAGTNPWPWDGVRNMMGSKGKKAKTTGDKKGKSLVIDIDLAPATADQEPAEASAATNVSDHPTIKILVQEPHIPYQLGPPLQQSNEYLNVHRSASPYDADIDSLDDRESNNANSVPDTTAL